MNSEAPVNAGHRFANTAEDYEENEMWLRAAEAHSKAAEQFEIALNDTVDEEATKTLKLLSSNHARKAAELNRKAQRLIKSAASQRMNHMIGSHSGMRSAHAKTGTGEELHYALSENGGSIGGNGSFASRLANSNRGEYSLDDGLHRTIGIGESYAILSNDDNEDDPFNKFLEAVEGLVQQLFNPAVAFTSVPLNENDITIVAPALPQEETTAGAKNNSPQNTVAMADSYYLVPSPGESSSNPMDHAVLTDRYGKTKKRSQSTNNYAEENEKLKAHISQLTKRMRSLEMSVEENNMLKSSVLQFRNDVHRQAKRIMQSHHESSMRASAAALLSTAGGNSAIHSSGRYPPLPTGGGTDLLSRLKDLEEENRQLRAQNEKQKALMNKYRERWEMLKENAKKRRTATTMENNTIVEENEN